MRRLAIVLLASIGLAIAWPQMPLTSAAPATVVSAMPSGAANRGGRAPILFNLVGASWTDSKIDEVTFRTSADGRTWTEWRTLEIEAGSGPDGNTPEGKRAHAQKFTSLTWVGDARYVQTRGLPAGKLHLINVNGNADSPGTAARAMRSLSRWASGSAEAYAAGSGPIGIYTRRQWGADETLREQTLPTYAPNAKMAVVHHTDSGNSYTYSQVPAVLRGIYRYHVSTRGFRDIAYNFLVDKWGRIWEGRWGGIDKAVSGAHTAGFNYATTGVSMLGTFTGTTPPTATLSGVARVLSWKFTVHRIRPRSATRYTVTPSDASGMRWKPGTVVTLNTISAHRDVNYTACPGAAGYRTMNWIRNHVWVRLPPAGAYVSDLKVVWKLTSRGKYATPSLQVWQSNVASGEILRLMPEELNAYPVLGYAAFRDGTLVRGLRPPDTAPSPSPSATASPEQSPSPSPSPTAVTYFVSNGLLRPFQAETDVVAMGFNPSRVLNVPSDVLGRYGLGAPIDPAAYPDGTLVRSSAASVPYVVKGGRKYAVVAPVFASRMYTNDDIVGVSSSVLDSIPFAGHLLFRDGSLIQSSSDPSKTVYAISDGRRRSISNSYVFRLLGYKAENVRIVSQTYVNLHALGPVLDGRGP